MTSKADLPGIAGPKAAKAVSLALQGGGAHGAFTWGVLDAILDDGRLAIEAISGTSAGAMNAVVMVDGFLDGGIDGARQHLRDFWRQVAARSAWSPLQRNLLDRMMGNWTYDSGPGFFWLDFWTRMLSPYETNPLNINPLRDVLDGLIDFPRVRRCDRVLLNVAATNVRTGKIAIFRCNELTADHVLASTCLPTMFQAVEIEGEAYWDGGYLGNPALYPLFYGPDTDDVILVQINPVRREDVPKTAAAIRDRLTEITFNATVLRELRAVKFVSDLIDEGKLSPDEYKRVRMHRIDGGQELQAITASSRAATDWAFLKHLRDLGRAAARTWLKENYAAIGKRSSLDLASEMG